MITLGTFGNKKNKEKTDTSVTMPNGETCKSGKCNPPKKGGGWASKFSMKVFKKKKYKTVPVEKTGGGDGGGKTRKTPSYIADPRNLGSMGITKYKTAFKRVSN